MNVLNEVGFDQNFSLKDIDVTVQALSSKQSTLDSFNTFNSISQQEIEEMIECNQNATKNIMLESQSSTEEFKQLFDSNEEDFKFCDWDEIE